MTKKIKIIDLLNKIANGEEVPKRIKVNDIEFEIYTESPNIDYQLANGQSTYLFQDYIHSFGEIKFNDEVEILDEEDGFEDIKELNKSDYQYSQCPSWKEKEEVIRIMNCNFDRHQQAIRDIIENQNKIIMRFKDEQN